MNTTPQKNAAPSKKKAALKVFGGRLYGRRRVIMATSSQRAFMKATGVSRDFFCETGNEEEVKLALSAPGVVFWRDSHAPEGFASSWHTINPRSVAK